MTIHSEFWKDRNAVNRRFAGLGAGLRSVRDSNRQRCYNWEFTNLRPTQRTMDRDEAKGYARLCVKIAIRHMRATGLILTDHVEAEVRASFKAAFTVENQKKCNANAIGAYFAKWGWTDVIIAHEVAHWADQWAHRLGGSPGTRVSYEAHGPRWRGWFLHILSSAGLRAMPGLLDPLGFLQRTMAEARLQVIMP